MNFLQLLKTSFLISPAGSYQTTGAVREAVLTRILYAAAAAGLFVVLLVANTGWQSGQWALLVALALLYLALLAVTFLRRLPLNLRISGLLFILFAYGTISLAQNGFSVEGCLLLLAVPILAALFWGMGGGFSTLALSSLSLAAVGLLASTGRLALPALEAAANTRQAWLVSGLIYLLTGVITVFSIAIRVESLEDSLKKEHSLASGIEDQQAELEHQIAMRTQAVERRSLQIRTAAEIARSISALLDPETILDQVVNLVHGRFHLYYVGVFLLDERGEYAVLKAGTGEAGQKMLAEGHQLGVGSGSMIGWTTANRQARIALDVGQDAVHFSNPYLPATRSELALPILAGQKMLGALTVQSTEEAAFDENDIIVLQGIADSLAVALENARLFSQTQQNLQEIQGLHRQYLARAWADIPHTQEELTYRFQPEAADEAVPLNTIQVPLTLRDQKIGQIVLEMESSSLSAEQASFIDAVTTQTALALENARLLEETQRRAERERLAASISGSVWASTDIETILRTALQDLSRSLNASQAVIKLDVPSTGARTEGPFETSHQGLSEELP